MSLLLISRHCAMCSQLEGAEARTLSKPSMTCTDVVPLPLQEKPQCLPGSKSPEIEVYETGYWLVNLP